MWLTDEEFKTAEEKGDLYKPTEDDPVSIDTAVNEVSLVVVCVSRVINLCGRRSRKVIRCGRLPIDRLHLREWRLETLLYRTLG